MYLLEFFSHCTWMNCSEKYVVHKDTIKSTMAKKNKRKKRRKCQNEKWKLLCTEMLSLERFWTHLGESGKDVCFASAKNVGIIWFLHFTMPENQRAATERHAERYCLFGFCNHLQFSILLKLFIRKPQQTNANSENVKNVREWEKMDSDDEETFLFILIKHYETVIFACNSCSSELVRLSVGRRQARKTSANVVHSI